ncbi:MAG: hypothetical protein II965_08240 [Pyramidobacter sp.]|nr:hypothetical protein [Pyramidobacter sp.]
MAIETNFPTFTGDESAEEQINALLNYITMLVEQLRYSLSNLDSSNFNAAALGNIKESATDDLRETLVAISARIAQQQLTLGNLQGRMTALEGLSGRVDDLEDSVAGLQESINTLEAGFAVNSSGNPSIGASGKRTDITGDVYINGVLEFSE